MSEVITFSLSLAYTGHVLYGSVVSVREGCVRLTTGFISSAQ